MIDYAKYDNMNTKQLVNSLAHLERKEQKYRTEIKIMQETIQYVQNRIQSTFKKSKKYNFIPLEKTGLAEIAAEIKNSMNADEYKQLRQEVKNEL